MTNCPSCKGSGKINITFSTFGSNKPPEVIAIDCSDCNGSGTLSDAQARDLESYKKFEEKAWCKCGNPSGDVKYHPKGMKYCAKHCYTCKDCGKLVQIG